VPRRSKRGVCQCVVIVKNQWVISLQLSLLASHIISMLFQHLHVECVINSGPFGYRFKLDDTPNVKKADQHCFNLGLWHPWLLWPGDSPWTVFYISNV
jgi:hypothetical protein